MPKKPTTKPDLTSVRSLVTSVTELAREVGLSNNAIYRWIKVNRIPGAHIIKVANLYDVELRDMMPLTGSDESNASTIKIKPKRTLETLIEVYRGNLTLDEAVSSTGQSEIGLKLILVHWGDELPTLYTTLEQLDQDRISLDEASARLGVVKYTLHGLRRKYGYAPGPCKRTRPMPTIEARQSLNREISLRCIAGKATVHDAAGENGMSERTLFRAIEDISPVKMKALSAWPPSFRRALVEEIEQKLPNYSQKWLQFAEDSRFFLPKQIKYPETPRSWRDKPLRRLLIGTLPGEESLENIAASRGADPKVLEGLFTSDLRVLGLSFDEVMGLPMAHQVALAELLIASMDRKRKWAGDDND